MSASKNAWGVSPTAKNDPSNLTEIMSDQFVAQCNTEIVEDTAVPLTAEDAMSSFDADMKLAMMLSNQLNGPGDADDADLKLAMELNEELNGDSSNDSDLAMAMALEQKLAKADYPATKDPENCSVSVVDHASPTGTVTKDYSHLDSLGESNYSAAVTNSIKNYEKKQTRKGISSSGKSSTQRASTVEGVFDARTRLFVFKLMQSGVLDHVSGVLKTGKESSVFFAEGDSMDGSGFTALKPSSYKRSEETAQNAALGAPANNMWLLTPKEELELSDSVKDEAETFSVSEDESKKLCNGEQFKMPYGVKIFRTTLNEFGNRADYVDGDPRYHGKFGSKMSKLEAIDKWCEKEHRNLIRAHKAGIRCPKPFLHKKHILIMSFIGTTEGVVSPQLREMSSITHPQLIPVNLDNLAYWEHMFVEIITSLRRLFHSAHLVHADCSAYNILVHDLHPVFIDFGQAVDVSHPRGNEYLRRDILSIVRFFVGTKALSQYTFMEERAVPLVETVVDRECVSFMPSEQYFDENPEERDPATPLLSLTTETPEECALVDRLLACIVMKEEEWQSLAVSDENEYDFCGVDEADTAYTVAESEVLRFLRSTNICHTVV